MFRYPDKPVRCPVSILQSMDDGQYIGTFKRDGWRVELEKTEVGEHVAFSRHDSRLDTLKDFDPKIMEEFKKLDLPAGTILDGEWERRRAGNKEGANRVAVWGVLKFAGQWLNTVVEEVRWNMILKMKFDGKYIFVPDHSNSGFVQFFEDSKKDWANEGIVLKHRKSKLILDLKSSANNKGWYKIKWRDGVNGQTIIA